MLFTSYMLLARVRRYLFICHTWKILLNHIFEDLRRTKAPNNYLQVYASGGSSWIIDSGCTNHMTGEKKMFTSVGTLKLGYPLLLYKDAVPTRLFIVAW
jgi:hypothetical protein